MKQDFIAAQLRVHLRLRGLIPQHAQPNVQLSALTESVFSQLSNGLTESVQDFTKTTIFSAIDG